MITIASILLVEDNPDDALLMNRAFIRAGLENPVIHISNGELAVRELQKCINGDTKKPALVLLDIKMPKMDGFEVLNWIRSQPQFAKLPVVILTSSNMSDDIQRARQFGASAFLTKPPTFEQLIEMVKQINKKWLVTV